MGFLSGLGWQGILSLVNQLWPVVTAAVHVAEAANPAPGSGTKKFNQVLDSVQNVALTLPPVVAAVQASGKQITDAAHAGDVQALSSGIGALINVAVRMANAAGVFQKAGIVQAGKDPDAQ